ncbi:Pycsar system effector family protein [Streptomyces massasporeus]|uniref:Pycsar system effector family protein n=1 Tax=Streptomyces massasporeus TaxID=67324 RepID=UPI00367ED741
MSDIGEGFGSTGLVGRGWLEAKAAEMFTEVQRADTKATALCGVAGGLLAVDAAAVSALPSAGGLSAAVLAGVAVLLGLSLIAALSAIRPVLPRGGRLRVFAREAVDCSRSEEVLSAVAAMSVDGPVRAEAERLALFTALAGRKFRAVRRAADLLAAAVALAGIGLLIACTPLESIAA